MICSEDRNVPPCVDSITCIVARVQTENLARHLLANTSYTRGCAYRTWSVMRSTALHIGDMHRLHWLAVALCNLPLDSIEVVPRTGWGD
jgi:hypothetical protein